MSFKHILVIVAMVMLLAGQALATTTPTMGDPIITDSRGNREVYLPITLTADGSGGAVTDYAIADSLVRGLQLVEVEIIHGTSTASITIENARDTEVWALEVLDATENKIYGGHTRWGVFPKMDVPWKLSTGTIAANDVVVLWLKFSTRP